MKTQDQITEQEKLIQNLRIDRLNANAKLYSIQEDIKMIDKNIKRAQLNIDCLKNLETIQPCETVVK